MTTDEAFDKYEAYLNLPIMDPGRGNWGSIQYDSAYAAYHLALDLIEAMTVEGFMKAFRISHDGPKPLVEVETNLYSELVEYANPSPNDKPWMLEDKAKEREEIKALAPKQRLTIHQWFEFTKSHSWDLWGAYLDPSFFLKNFEMAPPDELLVQNEGWPILNAIIMEDNPRMGIACALLTHYFGIDEEAYTEFDT